MKRVRYIFAAGVVSAVMAMSIPVYADRSGKVELPQDSTDYYMTVDSGGVGVDIYPETSDKSEKLNDKTVEDGTVLHIEGETEKNGESWGYTEYNGTHGYVPLDELRPSKEDEIAAEINTTETEKDSTAAEKESSAVEKDNSTAVEKDSLAAEKDSTASEKDSTVNRKDNTTDATDGENTIESEKSEELLETEDQSVVKMSPVPTEIEESVKTKPVNGTATASFKEEESWYQNPFLWIGCAAILAVIGILVYHFNKIK